MIDKQQGALFSDLSREICTTRATPIKKERERSFLLFKGENDAGCLYKVIDNHGNVAKVFIGNGKPVRYIFIPLGLWVKVKKIKEVESWPEA